MANPVKLTSPDSTSEHENFTKYVLEFENVLMDGMVLTDKEDDIQLPVEWCNYIFIDQMKIAATSYSVYFPLE